MLDNGSSHARVTKIFLTRHGETIENQKGVFMGHLPGRLSKNGRLQAKKLASRLKDEKFDCIFSSDLARASDTAREVARFHKNTKIIFTPGLRERALGELEGRKKSDLGLDNKLAAGVIETKTGEPRIDMFCRAKDFVESLHSDYFGKSILVVAHNGINLAIIANLLGKSFEEYPKIVPQKNCAVSIFSIKEKGFPAEIEVWNCVKHLQA